MKKQLHFLVTVPEVPSVSVPRFMGYIQDAVASWGGNEVECQPMPWGVLGALRKKGAVRVVHVQSPTREGVHFTSTKKVSEEARKRIVSAFMKGAMSNHTAHGYTLAVILDHCAEHRVPYLLEHAVNKEGTVSGYSVKKLDRRKI